MSDDQTWTAIAREHAATRQTLDEVKQWMRHIPPDRRAEIATKALEHFGRMAELYNDICVFFRAAQNGADGSA